ENVECWLECTQYRADPSKTKALAIIDKFVTDGRPDQVNLPGSASAQRVKGDLLAIGRKYRADQNEANQMGFFRRKWTASARKANGDVFNQLIAELENMMAGLLARFVETPRGAAAHARFVRANAMMPGNPAVYVALEEMGFA